MKKVIARLMRRWRYLRTWGTPIGKDCISLDTSLCRWLGTRLLFLADHTHGAPCGYMGSSWEDEDGTGYEQWKKDLAGAGNALLAWGNRYEEKYDEEHIYTPAQLALQWVAQNLANLWD